jgi:hypothetical protein
MGPETMVLETPELTMGPTHQVMRCGNRVMVSTVAANVLLAVGPHRQLAETAVIVRA